MEIDLFGIGEQSEEETKYTTKVSVPQYLPKNKCPQIEELVDTKKYIELLKHINDSNIPDEQKKFLKMGAMRHIVFNYDKIADYYAHASKEMQELMEESALVIIDFQDAIANGYIKLSKDLNENIMATGTHVKSSFNNQCKGE